MKSHAVAVVTATAVLAVAPPGAQLRAQAPYMSLTGGGYFSYWSLGRSVSGVGDIDGDGIDDFALGANVAGSGGPLRVHSGSTGDLITTWVALDDWVLTGRSIQRMGDANGDGVGDIVYGSPDQHPDGAQVDVISVRSLLFAGIPLAVPSVLPSGCPVYVGSPFALVVSLPVIGDAPGNGIASGVWQLPTGLLGTVGLQAFVLGPAPTGGYTATNGLTLTISPP